MVTLRVHGSLFVGLSDHDIHSLVNGQWLPVDAEDARRIIILNAETREDIEKAMLAAGIKP